MAKSFTEITKEYETLYFQFFPEQAVFYGRTDVPHDRFGDYSPEGIKKWQKEEDRFLALLQKIDKKTLNANELITFQLLQETLINSKESRILNLHLWHVSCTFSWHTYITQVAEQQPVGDVISREQALARWSTFGSFIDDQIASLEKGLESKFIATKPVVTRVIDQLRSLITQVVSDSPFYIMVTESKDEAFKEKMTAVIQDVINPALQKYQTFLEKIYLPAAREEQLGVSSLPCGEAGYQAKVKEYVTLDYSAEKIRDLGEAHMKVLEKEVAEIGKRLYKPTDMAENQPVDGTNLYSMANVFKHALENKSYLFTSAEELLEYNRAAQRRVNEKLLDWFEVKPDLEPTIEPFPVYLAKAGVTGTYTPSTEKKIGYFSINTDEPQKTSRIDQEATLVHELYPGHAYQIELQRGNKPLPSLNQYLWNAGYGEGWALYVERLADEMGLYSDDVSRLGMLSNEALRTARLLVDTGIHVYGWTREEAVKYLKEHTACSDKVIQCEVDRYISMPGQASAYMLGKFEIERLRDLAKRELKDDFDIRKFHTQVMKNGVITLPMLTQQITNWIEEQKQSKKARTDIAASKSSPQLFFSIAPSPQHYERHSQHLKTEKVY